MANQLDQSYLFDYVSNETSNQYVLKNDILCQNFQGVSKNWHANTYII